MHVACEENLNVFILKYKWFVADLAARLFVSVNVNDLGIIVTQLFKQKEEKHSSVHHVCFKFLIVC